MRIRKENAPRKEASIFCLPSLGQTGIFEKRLTNEWILSYPYHLFHNFLSICRPDGSSQRQGYCVATRTTQNSGSVRATSQPGLRSPMRGVDKGILSTSRNGALMGRGHIDPKGKGANYGRNHG